MNDQNEIVLYRPDETLSLDVRVADETVWLNRQQMAELFDRDVKTIGKHIKNALSEELAVVAKNETTQMATVANYAPVAHSLAPVVAKFATTASDGKNYQVEYYSLDVIISVGYRVKSNQGIAFRRWANSVLRQYLLNGVAFAQRFERLEHRVATVEERQDAFDIEIHAALPSREGIFFEGQVFDARVFVEDLIRGAKREIILVDAYVNSDVIAMLNERSASVKATIYTDQISPALRQAEELNEKQNGRAVELKQYRANFHDRFLIIDDDLYHFGASFKDLGKRLFGFEKMGLDKQVILSQL